VGIRTGRLADALSRHLLLALGFTALLLGLLGMHTLGIDHVAPSHHQAAAVPETHGVESQHHHAAPTTGALQDAGAAHGPGAVQDATDQPWCAEDCGLHAAVAGMCVMALVGGSVLLHLAARALRPVPGAGLAETPRRQVPRDRRPPPPSLVQLSVSRT
jgi:hypothetical protein